MPKKILTVDDEEDIRMLVKTILEEEGYKVDTAEDGKTALEKVKKNKYDLVLLDMFMPGMSGRETCEKIRQDKKIGKTKVAFLTVARFSELGQKTLDDLKVADYITKPFDNEDLKKRVKKIL